VVRWVLQWGGRWLAQQAWRGVRRGAAAQTPRDPGEEKSKPETKRTCAMAVVCSSRLLFDGITDAMSQRRTFEADGFKVVSGNSSGAPIVVAVPLLKSAIAPRIVSAILHGHRPGFIVAVGEGTSCVERVLEGEVVAASELTGPDGDSLHLDVRVPLATWVHLGRVDAVPGLSHETLAIDSWSWDNAIACRRFDVPFIALTGITRPCAARQSAAIEAIRQPSNVVRRTGALAGMVWNRPKDLKRVWQLQSAAWQASDRIAKLVSVMAEASRNRP
jgi:hypothetical protein